MLFEAGSCNDCETCIYPREGEPRYLPDLWRNVIIVRCVSGNSPIFCFLNLFPIHCCFTDCVSHTEANKICFSMWSAKQNHAGGIITWVSNNLEFLRASASHSLQAIRAEILWENRGWVSQKRNTSLELFPGSLHMMGIISILAHREKWHLMFASLLKIILNALSVCHCWGWGCRELWSRR